MADLPQGTVTFLFTDVEGSTRLWEEAPDVMMRALQLHDEAIDVAAATHEGTSVKPRGEGDSRFVVFRSAPDAVNAAADIQHRLAGVDWPTPRPLKVRASVHTGPAQLELGDYYGSTVNRAARLRAIAHGGQTVISGTTHDLVVGRLGEEIGLIDMGWHRLKDLTRPEHVYQLEIEGLDTSFPPLVSLNAFPNNLPEQMTELIGRDAEVARVQNLLETSRLVTILAPGGSGKTHLATQVAANLSTHFPDGVWFIALADISDSAEIVQTVASTLGIALSSERDPLTQLLGYLAPRRQLLLFDNFEHVVDGAPLVSQILKTAPGVEVIATSRTKLGLGGEAVLRLEGLASTWADPAEALSGSGVQLFLDAAQRADPDFTITDEDLGPLSQILTLTGGVPLGIVLAAAWVDVLSTSEIADEITKSLDFLESTATDMPERHRSVRAAFDYSWNLLDEGEQATFAALSVFRGGFTREAAGSVAGADLRDLAGLARKSLVRADPETGRYSLHELLRQYAESALAGEAGRDVAIRQAHARYYADLAMTAGNMYHSPDQALSWEIVGPDLDNIRRAWRHHIDAKDVGRLASMVPALWIAHEVRGWYHAGLDLLGPALESIPSEASDSLAFRARALAVHAAFALVVGRRDEADRESHEAVMLGEAAGDPESLFLALHLRSQVVLYLGRSLEARQTVERALGLAEDSSNEWATAVFWAAGLKNLGAFAAIASGDEDSAVRLLDESRDLLEPSGETYYMSWNYAHRARLQLRVGRFDDAAELFHQAAERAQRLGFLRGIQLFLLGMGDAEFAAGEHTGAREAFVESLDAAERAGMIVEMLATLVRIGRAMVNGGEVEEAVRMLAMVEAEPDSRARLFTDSEEIEKMASSELAELEQAMDPSVFAQLRSQGARLQYRTVVKQLTDDTRSGGMMQMAGTQSPSPEV